MPRQKGVPGGGWLCRITSESNHFVYCISDIHSGCVSGDIAPWAGTKMDGSDVTTQIMIVNCNEYQL